MKATGIIVEYNPFHYGHLFHIQQSKIKSNADIVIAIMSGNFLQRGEPAIVSKQYRTKMALIYGADIVVELPYTYATQKADTFAFGAVSILNELFISSLCFGSESGDIEQFTYTLQLLNEHQNEYNNAVKKGLAKGYSYPRANSEAFKEIQKIATRDTIDLTKPNNILGFQYISAIQKINRNITPYTIKRSGANYHELIDETVKIASATGIRTEIFNKNSLQEVADFIPPKVYDLLAKYKKYYKNFHEWELYFPFLKYRLLTMSTNELQAIYEVEEGIEHRLLSSIKESGSFQEFIAKVKTKRYTWTKLQRLCVHVITNTTKDQMRNAMEEKPYIRLLGLNVQGQKYLNTIKKKVNIPIISKVTNLEHPQLQLDLKVARAYASALNDPKLMLEEWANPPLRYNEVDKIFM